MAILNLTQNQEIYVFFAVVQVPGGRADEDELHFRGEIFTFSVFLSVCYHISISSKCEDMFKRNEIFINFHEIF